ncbi:MAG: phosphoglucosamine mutase [Magnetovibrionaceae bacterium]
MTKLFGTDGIRAKANADAMSPCTVLKVGLAIAKVLRSRTPRNPAAKGETRHRVVIGKDTRLSGYMIESALTAGLVSGGVDPVLLGPMPTPAVSMLTTSLRADFGIMITASHNPYTDNGIKMFGSDGYKISDAEQDEIEALVQGDLTTLRVEADELGRAKRLDDAVARYIESAKRSFPTDLTLEGMRLVVDCAHGATYRVAPQVLSELGADISVIGCEPDGFNINQDCGSTDTRALRAEVIRTGADLGIAFDGDGDRLILCDEKGQVIDGDQIIALVAARMKKAGTLSSGGAVASVMSNMALDKHLSDQDIVLHRAPVGDRNVVRMMRETGAVLGGESSGHVIIGKGATTGDGLVAALQVLAALVVDERPASEICTRFTPFAQSQQNVRTANKAILDDQAVKSAIDRETAQLEDKGRLLVRASGTEPLIRILGEGEDATAIREAVMRIAEELENAA